MQEDQLNKDQTSASPQTSTSNQDPNGAQPPQQVESQDHLQMEDIESIVLPDEAPLLYDEAGFPIESYKQQTEAQLGWGEDLLPPNETEEEPPADLKKQPESEDDESEQIADRRMKNSQNRAEQNEHSEQPLQSQQQAESNQMEDEAQNIDTSEQLQQFNNPEKITELVQNTIFKCQSIVQAIKGNTEPTNEITGVVTTLQEANQYIVHAIKNVLTAEHSAELIKAFKDMADAMLNEQIIMDTTYLVTIFNFFHSLIVDYYGPLIERLDVCQLIDEVFNDRANLYQAIFPVQNRHSRRNGGSSQSNKQGNNAQEDKKREDMRENLNFESDKKVYARIANEAPWRTSLNVGDYLDALSQYKTPQSNSYHFILGWTPAKVLAVEDDNTLIIGFLGRSQASNIKYSRQSEKIAPFKKYTDNMAWKETIKPDDLLDACDEYGVWYKSTLAKRQLADDNEVDCDGNPVEIFHILCRYPDPEGTKVKNGVNVTGWLRDDFDLYLEKGAPCIRPFGKYTNQYYNVAPEDMKYDLEVSDQEDYLYQASVIMQYGRERKNHYGGIKYVGTIIDEFGLNNGFGNILKFMAQIKNGDLKVSVEHLGLVMVFLARTLPFWTREFMCTQIETFNQAFVTAIGTKQASNPLNLPHNEGHRNILLNNYHMLLRRYYVNRKHTKMLNYVNSMVGCSLLKLENLEKRIQGIKLISTQISNLVYMENAMRKKEEVVADLIELNAFEIVFSSKNYHQQILQRAEDVLRLYAQTHSLTPELINILWETRQMDETACISVYNIISECVGGMQKEIVNYFVGKVKEIAPSSMQLRDVELLHTIGKTGVTTNPTSRFCADALWNIIIFDQKIGYSKQVMKAACKKLCELLKVFDTNTKVEFINLCIFHVSDPSLISLQVLKILFKTISWLPRQTAWMNNQSITMKSFVTELVTEAQLIDVLLQDLQSYKENALKLWQSEDGNGVFCPRTLDTFLLFNEGYTHGKNLEVRLNGLLFILESTVIQGPRISAEQLQRLWDILLTNTKLPGDQRAFMRFFRRVLQERSWLDIRIVCQFFEEKVEQNLQIAQEISVDGFMCIQTMFLYINEFENSINIIKQPVQEKTENGSAQGQGQNGMGWSVTQIRRNKTQRNGAAWVDTSNQARSAGLKDKLEFRVHKHPSELRGIEILWLIFQQSPSHDLDLLAQVVHFLAQVYHSISRVLDSDRQQIYSDFVKESLGRLQTCLQDGNNGISAVQKRDLVKNTMNMLVHSLADTEISGSCAIRPHFNIDGSSQLIEEITVQSYLTKEGQPKYFRFCVDGRMTVWEFIDFIAQKLNHSPRKIKVQRVSSNYGNEKKQEFTCYTHCSTLHEMKVDNGEEFTIMRNLNSNEKVPLTNPQTNEMVPDVRIIFEEWFEMFARPREEFEDAENLTEEKYMDRKACVNFMFSTIKDNRLNNNIHASSPESFTINENSTTINSLYKEYDSDEDGRLTKSDFLRFYQTKCLQQPAVVWQNLEKHNVGKDLMTGQAQDYDLTYDNDSSLVTSQDQLPRYFISANQNQFNSLFDLEQVLKSSATENYLQETMDSVWKLIGKLKTNPKLYLSLLKNEDLESRLGQPNELSHYRLLYTLQIIYSLISNYRSTQNSKVTIFSEKASQIKRLWAGNDKDIDASDYHKAFPSLEESKSNSKDEMLTKNLNPIDQVMEEDEENEQDESDKYQQKTMHGNQGNNQGSSGDQPIVLQDAAAVEKEKAQNQAQNQQYDRFGNTMTYSKRHIQGWKGEVANEILQINQVSDDELIKMLKQEILLKDEREVENYEQLAQQRQEMLDQVSDQLKELKSQWLLDFIAKNGFSYLLTIMKTIVSKNSQTMDKTQILSQNAEVSTLHLTTYLIKVVLVSCFCSQTQDSNLAGNLQRKMSMRDDESEGHNAGTEKQKNDLIAKQKNITDEFKQLTHMFTDDEAGIAPKLLQSIDLSELQDLLQSTLRMILRKQSLINEKDRQVVAECLDIWVSCITFNNELLLKIYGNDEFSTTEIVTMLIEQGLFSETTSLRKQFKEAIEFMSFNIKSGNLSQAPYSFFLKKLLGKISYSKQLSFTRTPEYYDLLTKLINHYFTQRDREPQNFEEIFQPQVLIKDLISSLEQYKSQESKTSVVADFTLVGILNLVRTLLESNNDLLDQTECSMIMNMLIRQCLFNQAQTAYSGHITGTIDLSSHQSSQINKCHTDDSRNAAYKLLDTVINSNSDPTLIQTLVQDFWSPFILQLTEQKESGIAPQDSGRSMLGFAGLKNLGCICYMNSVLQQLFNVPTFRYSLMAADDKLPIEMQQDKRGIQVDNNSLHQWMKMFSFLQMSDRQEYNPVEFCFAFKELNGEPVNVRVQQDAQEFLNHGFDSLEKLLKDTPQKYLCQNAFQGKMASLTVCKNCGNIVCTDEDFYTLQCTVKNQKTLQQSLESMIAGEMIEDYNCSACNKKVTIEKKQCIRKLPNTLIVHLNRIVFDFDTMRNQKLNDKLEFPNELNIRQFMLHQVLQDLKKKDEQAFDVEPAGNQNEGQENEEEVRGNADKQAAQQEEDDEDRQRREQEQQKLQKLVKEGQKLTDEEFDYKLVGVVIHMGIADAGHYISYVNIDRENNPTDDKSQWVQTDKQTWLEFNDSIVSTFDFSQMQFKAFGEDDTNQAAMVDYNDIGNQVQQSHNAYMLIYEKAEKKPLKLVCSDQNLELIKSQPRSVIERLTEMTNGNSQAPPTTALSCDGTAIPREEEKKDDLTRSIQSDQTMQSAASSVSKAASDQMLSSRADTEMSTASTQIDTSTASKKTMQLSAVDEVAFADFIDKLPHSFLIYPGLVNRIYSDDSALTYDEEKKENMVDVGFHNVTKFVPNKYYRSVHQDNQLFLAEKQVFCTPFFKTSAQLIEQYLNSVEREAVLMGEQQTKAKLQHVYTMLDKLIFDMLVNGTEEQQKNLPSMTNLMFRVLDKNQDTLLQLVKNRILIGIDEQDNGAAQENSNLIDTSDNANKKAKTLEDKIFLDMLVTGKTFQVRELGEQILTKVLLNLFDKLDQEEQMVDKRQIEELIELLIKELLALIPTEVQKFWHKLGPFFTLFFNLVQDGNLRRLNYFVRCGLIQRLVDLTGRYNSQQEYSVPPFDKLVATVCILARSQPVLIYLFGIPEEFQPTEEEIRNELDRVPLSPHFLHYQAGPASGIILSTADVRSLLMFGKRAKEFYNIALKNTQESQHIAWLIGHLCWGNYEVSRRFGKLILKGLNAVNELEVKPYVDCMKVYLALNDQFQEERVEWLMGISSANLNSQQNQYQNSQSYKVGVANITHVEDPICEYQTTLFKAASEYTEPVLRMIYKYRKEKFVRAALALLEGVTWVMANADLNNVLLKYLLSLEPPAYTCRRYWDWIEAYIQNKIQACSDATNLASSSDELEICMRIYSNIDHTKNLFGPIIDPDSEEKLWEKGVGGRSVPDAYLMWDIVNDRQIAKFPNNENAKAYISLHECLVNVSKSRPTGSDNLSLETFQQNRWGKRMVQRKRYKKAGTTSRNKKQVPAGGETSQSDVRRNFIAKRSQRKANQKRSKAPGVDGNDSQDADSSGFEDNDQEDHTKSNNQNNSTSANNQQESVDDSKEQTQVDIRVNLQQNPTFEMFEEQPDGVNQEQEQVVTEETVVPGQGPNPQQAALEGASDEPKPAPADTEMQNETAKDAEQEDQNEMRADLGAKPSDNIDIEGAAPADDHQMQNPYRLPDDEINGNDQQENQQQQEDQEEEEEEDSKSEQYSILVFMINNNTRYDTKFTIQWDQAARNKVNFRMPATEFYETIQGGKNKLVLKFSKTKLNQDWGDIFNFKCIIDGEDVSTGEKWTNLSRDHYDLRQAKLPLIVAAEAEKQMLAAQQQQQPIDEDLYGDGQANYGGASEGGIAGDIDDPDFGKVNCPVCTFLQSPNNTSCECCGSGM